MSRTYYTAHRDGAMLGWVKYENTSDIWCEYLCATKEDARADRGRRCACAREWDLAGLPSSLPRVRMEDKSGEWAGDLRWCAKCESIVTPPFDGYAYHDYECRGTYAKNFHDCTCKSEFDHLEGV